MPLAQRSVSRPFLTVFERITSSFINEQSSIARALVVWYFDILRSANMRHIWAVVMATGLAFAASPWFAMLAQAGDGGGGP